MLFLVTLLLLVSVSQGFLFDSKPFLSASTDRDDRPVHMAMGHTNSDGVFHGMITQHDLESPSPLNLERNSKSGRRSAGVRRDSRCRTPHAPDEFEMFNKRLRKKKVPR